jgi:hypothetical protein
MLKRFLLVTLWVMFVLPFFVFAQAQPTFCLPTLAPDSSTPVPQPGTPIKFGDTVSGYLTNCGKVVYSFRGKADEVVTVIADGSRSGNAAPCLSLTDANGILVASSKSEYWNNLPRGTMRYVSLQIDGEYSIRVDFCNTSNSEFTLHLDLTPAIAVKYGQIIKGVPINPGNASGYEFDGLMGDEVFIQLGPTGLNAQVEIFCVPRPICGNPGSNYNVLATYNIIPGTYPNPIMLPVSGKFMLVIQTVNGPSEFNLAINRVAPSRIEYGDTVEVRLNEMSSVGQYSFTGEFGDSVRVKVESGGRIDTTLALLTGRHNLLNTSNVSFDDDEGDGFDPEFNKILLPENDVYTILLQPYQLGDKGLVRLSVTHEPNLSLDEQSQPITLTNKYATKVVEFTEKASRNVRLTLKRIAYAATLPQLTIYQKSKVIATSASSNAEVSSIEFLVPEDGRVVVFVNGSPGTVELSLERLGQAE